MSEERKRGRTTKDKEGNAAYHALSKTRSKRKLFDLPPMGTLERKYMKNHYPEDTNENV